MTFVRGEAAHKSQKSLSRSSRKRRNGIFYVRTLLKKEMLSLMLRTLFFVCLLLLAPSVAMGASGAKVYDFSDAKGTNAIALSIDAPFEPVVGYATGITGSATFDPAAPEKTTGKIVVDVSSVRFSNEGYTGTVRFFALQEKKFPQIICELKRIVRGRMVKPGVYEGKVEAAFTCKGVTKMQVFDLSVRHFPGAARQRVPDIDGDLLNVRCNFKIRRSDYGIAKDVEAELIGDDVEVRVALIGIAGKKREEKPVPPPADAPKKAEAPKDIPLTVNGKNYSLAERMAFHKIPGVSVALIRDFEIAWVANFGEADKGRPMTADTLFQAGTMGNTLVTSAALRAVQEKRIALDGPAQYDIAAWRVPSFPGGRPLTLRDLLENKSGLTYHKYYGYERAKPVPTLLQVLNGEKPAVTPPVKLVTAPGTLYNLAAENYVVLQKVAEERSGQPFNAVMREFVFDPLGMTRSTFAQPLPESRCSEAAVGHDDEGKPLPGGWRVYPEAAASGLWTTPREFAVYLADFLRSAAGRDDAKILSPASAKTMLTPVAIEKDGDEQYMGIGRDRWNGRDCLFRGGNTQGYYTIFNARPETGSAILIMVNRNLCWQFANEVRDALARQESWKGF